MANDEHPIEWKTGFDTATWSRLMRKLTKMLESIPNKSPGEFAVVTRKPTDKESTGTVVNAVTFDEIAITILDRDKDSFSATWFKAQEDNVGVLLVKLTGEGRGTHYLVGPNEFPEEMKNRLNFLRSMEKASDNSGPA